jgi:hypothetical protein
VPKVKIAAAEKALIHGVKIEAACNALFSSRS